VTVDGAAPTSVVSSRLASGRPARRVIRDGGLAVAIFLVALWVFGGAAERVPYWGDEGNYLITARYFRYLFVERDISRPEWGDNYRTHTQPMLTRYLVGGWLWHRGYDLDAMPPPYDFTNSFRENQRKGRVPDDALMADSRAPILPVAAGTIVLLYLLGTALGGVVAGLAAASLALASPLAQTHLVRAMSEAPLAFFILLALLLGVLGARRGAGGGLPAGWAVALGVALGLGLGTKLTAVLGLTATAGWGGAMAVAAAIRTPDAGARGPEPEQLEAARSRPRDRLARAWGAARGWALALAVAYGVFVLSNPHLYPNPVEHTAHLFQNRVREELGRQREAPRYAVRDPLERPGRVLDGTFVEGPLLGSHGVPLEAALAAFGAATLAAGTWRGWRRTGLIPAGGLALWTTLVYVVGTSAALYQDHTRYYVPTFLLGMLLSGLGVTALLRAIRSRWPTPTPREVGSPGRLQHESG
jgi:hypothetical protein